VTQFARPDTTVDLGTFTVVPSGTAHAATDEAILDTADYVQSVAAPVGEDLTLELSRVADPEFHTSHVIHVILGKDLAGGARIDALIEFLETATLIASFTQPDLSATPTDYPLTLTEPQAAAITGASYAGALRIRVTFTQV
jgi:hypothetical protein